MGRRLRIRITIQLIAAVMKLAENDLLPDKENTVLLNRAAGSSAPNLHFLALLPFNFWAIFQCLHPQTEHIIYLIYLMEYSTFWTQRDWLLFDILLPWGRGSVLRGTDVPYLPQEWTKSPSAGVWRNRGKECSERQDAKWDIEGSRANTAPVIRFLPDLGADGLSFLACASRSPGSCDQVFSLNPG